MLITLKTLNQKTFKIELEESEKILRLKEKIAEERSQDEYPVERQKLIYSGRILEDDKLLSECNISSDNFIVLMAVKQKPKVEENPEEMESSEPTETQDPEQSSADDTSTESHTSAESAVESPDNTPQRGRNARGLAEATLLSGSNLESLIGALSGLGYSREQVMRAALNRRLANLDQTTAERLLSESTPSTPTNMHTEVEPNTDEDTTPDSVGDGDDEAADLSFLRNSPQFLSLRSQVQARPESLPQLLQAIGTTNPALLALIMQNQEQFVSILNERSETDAGTRGGITRMANDAGNRGGMTGMVNGAGETFRVQVTASEKEAIDRLVSMGFSETDVLQAFFACDKNEQLAIDFLISDTY